MGTTANSMRNSYWIAINSTRPTKEVLKIFQEVKLSQKGLTDFWGAFHKVKDYIN